MGREKPASLKGHAGFFVPHVLPRSRALVVTRLNVMVRFSLVQIKRIIGFIAGCRHLLSERFPSFRGLLEQVHQSRFCFWLVVQASENFPHGRFELRAVRRIVIDYHGAFQR
jgi:hypothetical protein